MAPFLLRPHVRVAGIAADAPQAAAETPHFLFLFCKPLKKHFLAGWRTISLRRGGENGCLVVNYLLR